MSPRQQDALTTVLRDAALAGAFVAVICLGSWLDAGDEADIAHQIELETVRVGAELRARDNMRQEVAPELRDAYLRGLADGEERERTRWIEARGAMR